MRGIQRFLIAIAAGVCAAFGARVASAGPVLFTQDFNPQQNVPGISPSVATNGAQMTGMTVTARFSDNSVETVIWLATGASSGAATGTGWIMSESGDTFSASFTLTNSRPAVTLTGFTLDGFGGGLAAVRSSFDRTYTSFPGTPDSGSGRDYVDVTAEPFTINVKYRGALAVTPAAPVGDEFRFMDADFTVGAGGPPTGLNTANPTLQFGIDVDTVLPEPTAGALVLVVVTAISARRRRGRVRSPATTC